MKTFIYDDKGNLTVKNSQVKTVEIGGEPQEVTEETKQEISPAQLAVHLPLFIAEMSADDLLKAQTIIKGLAGV